MMTYMPCTPGPPPCMNQVARTRHDLGAARSRGPGLWEEVQYLPASPLVPYLSGSIGTPSHSAKIPLVADGGTPIMMAASPRRLQQPINHVLAVHPIWYLDSMIDIYLGQSLVSLTGEKSQKKGRVRM